MGSGGRCDLHLTARSCLYFVYKCLEPLSILRDLSMSVVNPNENVANPILSLKALRWVTIA